MVESSSTKSPLQPEPSRAPVWASNPGVPFTARLLAITFGVLLAFTVVFSLISERPPDLPATPARWTSYATKLGLSLPVPVGWNTRIMSDDVDYVELLFSQMEGGPVVVRLLNAMRPEAVSDADLDLIRKDFTEKTLARFYKNYATVSPDNNADTRRFTCSIDGISMTGAWVLRAKGHAVAALVAITPADGQPIMDGILAKMADGMQFPAE